MKLTSNATDDGEVFGVGLELTIDEARELRDALHHLIEEPGRGHHHISAADYQTEVTVWIEGHP